MCEQIGLTEGQTKASNVIDLLQWKKERSCSNCHYHVATHGSCINKHYISGLTRQQFRRVARGGICPYFAKKTSLEAEHEANQKH